MRSNHRWLARVAFRLKKKYLRALQREILDDMREYNRVCKLENFQTFGTGEISQNKDIENSTHLQAKESTLRLGEDASSMRYQLRNFGMVVPKSSSRQ